MPTDSTPATAASRAGGEIAACAGGAGSAVARETVRRKRSTAAFNVADVPRFRDHSRLAPRSPAWTARARRFLPACGRGGVARPVARPRVLRRGRAGSGEAVREPGAEALGRTLAADRAQAEESAVPGGAPLRRQGPVRVRASRRGLGGGDRGDRRQPR